MDLLTVENVCKNYKDFSLKNISFSLPQGYILGYVGQNGAGKTTTLNIISHLIKSDSGKIFINDISYEDDPIKYKEMIGYIGDESYLPFDFKIGDIKAILTSFYPTFDETKFEEYITRWKLPKDKKIKDFSKGMKVRLMFANVLSRDTKLLILDEASNGLDPVVKEEILELLQEYIEDGTKSVLFSTHIISDLEQIADYIFFIDNGEKLLFENKDELLEKYVVVKGGLDDLSDDIKDKIIGLKKHKVGFEGVLKSNDTVFAGKDCVIEKPTIEQLMVHFIMQRGGVI